MSALVAELVELARGDEQPQEPEDVRLDLVAAEAIERTRRNRPGVDVQPAARGVARARRSRRRSSAPSRTCSTTRRSGARRAARSTSTVHDGELAVRDHGPGIAEEDVPFIFDRFYRAPSARSMPGLGPRPRDRAPGRRGARRHRSSVEAPEGGGTRMRLRLPSANGSEPFPIDESIGRAFSRLTNQSGLRKSCARA